MKKFHLVSFPLIAIGLFVGYAFLVSAAAPSGGYTPGATLDPDCAPGDTDCIVIAGGSSQWTDVAAGTDLIQVSGSGLDDVTSSGEYNYFGEFGVFVVGNAGDTMLAIENRTDGFADGQIITGGTSGAAGTVRFFTEIPEAYVFLDNVTGTFVPGEVISNFDNGGTADVLSATVTTADSFIWQEQDIPEVGILEMTGSAQTLFDSFNITWGSTSGHTVGDQWQLAITQSGIAYDSGAVGIGTNNPLYDLYVDGEFSTEFTDGTFVSRLLSTLESGTGLIRGDTAGNIGTLSLSDNGSFNYTKSLAGLFNPPSMLFRIGDGADWSASGEENKFFFDDGINSGSPSIRLGSVDNNNWDSFNRGDRSIAIGFADSGNSVQAPLASGDLSVAIGSGASATGLGSIAIGFNSVVNSVAGAAIGTTNQLLNVDENSFAFGSLNTVNLGADRSMLVGSNNTSNASYSYAFGNGITFNPSVNSNGASFGIGFNSTVNGNQAFAIGNNLTTHAGHETVMGYYNTAYTPVTDDGYNNADRLFTIGNGVSPGSGASDAFTILKSGQIGIGIDNFEASADASALLTLGSTTQGVLFPRMTAIERDAITSPATGLFVYNTDDDEYNFFDSSIWQPFGGNNLIGSTTSDQGLDDQAWLGNGAGGNVLGGFFEGSTFIGGYAGFESGGAYSTFIGSLAGYQAASSSSSIFIGRNAGNQAANAGNSILIGGGAGSSTTNAGKSIFIGIGAGASDTVDNNQNADDYSILIGNNTDTGGFSNSIALGNAATNTATNQFMIGSATSPIDEIRVVQTGGTECIIDGTGLGCTSDERLKTNISDLDNDTLSKLLNVRTVSYNWNHSPNGQTNIGFLAQDLEQYFPELVSTNERGQKSVYYAQMTPVLVEAIRELDLKISDFQDVSEGSTFGDMLRGWFADATNGIQKLFVKDVETENIKTNNLCVGQVCVTQEQFLNIVNQSNQTPSAPTPEPFIDNPVQEPGNETSPVEESVITPDPVPEEVTVEPESIVTEDQAPVETPSETVSE